MHCPLSIIVLHRFGQLYSKLGGENNRGWEDTVRSQIACSSHRSQEALIVFCVRPKIGRAAGQNANRALWFGNNNNWIPEIEACHLFQLLLHSGSPTVGRWKNEKQRLLSVADHTFVHQRCRRKTLLKLYNRVYFVNSLPIPIALVVKKHTHCIYLSNHQN